MNVAFVAVNAARNRPEPLLLSHGKGQDIICSRGLRTKLENWRESGRELQAFFWVPSQNNYGIRNNCDYT